MTDAELKQTVLDALCSVAPEADPSALDPALPTRDQLDMDSMDHLNFVIALSKALSIEIPEKDSPRLATIDGAVGYLRARGA